MASPFHISKSENVLRSSLGTVFSHRLSSGGVQITPAGILGECRVQLRDAAANSVAFLSLSDSITVTIQASGNAIRADIICQLYHSIIQ